MFNVYDDRRSVIAARRAACVARIARQRDQVEEEFGRLRAPLRAVDAAVRLASRVREHSGVISMVAVPLLLLARRRLARGTVETARVAPKLARWWTLWKFGAGLVSGWLGRRAAPRR